MIARPVWSRRFIGRNDELEFLHASRRSIGKSRGSIVLVGGEAGIGKSRLIDEFSRTSSAGRTGRLMRAECVRGFEAALWPIRAFLEESIGDAAASAPPIVMRTLAQLVPDVLAPADVLRYRGAVLGSAELFAGLAATFAHMSARRGAVLLIEDLHWSDRSTLEFLAYLAPRIASMRVLVIATYRTDALGDNASLAELTADMLRERAVGHIILEPLPKVEVLALLDAASDGQEAIATETLSEIERRCDGNPFYAEELLKSALETRAAGDTVLPISIRENIRHHLQALTAADRGVLEIAAIVGYRFDPVVVAEAANRPFEDVAAALRRARNANIVIDEGEGRCRFRHALTQQTIVDDLLSVEAQSLHERLLRIFESRADDERHLDELAYHAWEARDFDAARRYNERAAQRALSFGAFPEARACLERSLHLAASTLHRAHLHEELGRIAQQQGDLAAAAAAFETALALRLENRDYDDAARIAVSLAGNRSNLGIDAEPALRSFLAANAAQMLVASRDLIYVFLARLISAGGRLVEAEALLTKASAPPALPPRVRANYYATALNLHAWRGRIEAWREAAAHVTALVPDIPPYLAAVTLVAVAQTGIWLGEGDVVRTSLDAARALSDQFSFDSLSVFCSAIAAQNAYALGDLTAAQTMLDAVYARPDIGVAQIAAAQVAMFVAQAVGDAEIGRRFLRIVVVRDTIDSGVADVDTLAVRAAALVSTMPHVQAVERDRFIHDLVALADESRLQALCWIAAAQYASDADLERVCSAADDAVVKVPDRVNTAMRALVRAVAAKRTGRPIFDAATEAADIFASLGWPLFEAQACMLAGDDARARALFAHCGAVALFASAPAASAASARPASLLTPREHDVALLVAAGDANAVIAQRLNVGIKTVEKHVSAILLKLGVRSRSQVAALVASGQYRQTVGFSPRDEAVFGD